ncbi:TIR domain-containing protein [Nocardia sp. NPDC006630]|uniref:TIR domain-containing protein n=1 Tax=Nocardia sp. NPDC006630 TaxID=3157181 RepID=UPI0033B6B92C
MVVALSAFWSYTRDDDECSDRHVTKLSKQISRAFKLINGNPLQVFIDRDSIEWGEEWKTRIDNSIHGATLFIPIITPSYLRSSACRYEFLTFWSKSRPSNLTQLVLPIVYADTDMNVDSDDEIVSIISSLQCEFWHETRLEDESSSVYKRAVHDLAVRIKQISDSMESIPEIVSTSDNPDDSGTGDGSRVEDEDDEPGILERIAELEEHAEIWPRTVEDMTAAINSLSAAMDACQPDLEDAKRSSQMSQRLVIFRRISNRLLPPSNDFHQAAEVYKNTMIAMDVGFSAFIQHAKMAPSEDREGVADLADTIQGMHEAVTQALSESKPLAEAMETASTMSRDMRKPSRAITSGLRMVADTQTIIENWLTGLRGSK